MDIIDDFSETASHRAPVPAESGNRACSDRNHSCTVFESNMADNPEELPTIETRTTIQTLRPDGILVVVTKDNAEMSLQDAKENHDAGEKLCGGHARLVLVDSRPLRTMTREARHFFANAEVRKYTVAQAILVARGISRVVGNFFIGVGKPSFPTRLFTSFDAAVEWLTVQGKDA